MAPTPHRPYVPHRTPTRGQPAIAPADFALAKPFVPGAVQAHSFVVEVATSATPVADTPMASIETFLAAPQTSVKMPPVDLAVDDAVAEEPEELPPLEHFLDPLPPISDFSTSVADKVVGEDFPDEAADVESRDRGESDWVETDWQRYDWQSAAALGDAERAQAEASNAWATTDWEVPSPRKSETSKTPADAIALALDKIAERIRNGDLALPGGGTVADPATIAATLAALLGVRR